MIASLGMYDRSEVAHANDALWGLIRDHLGFGPDRLNRDTPFWESWQSPGLLFSQTCGLPYRSILHKSVTLVGTPDYGIMGCEPGFYRSVIIARRLSGAEVTDVSTLRFAFNEQRSQSGWAAFWDHVEGDAPPAEVIETGGHIASAKAVAEGRADIASIDMHTWKMICTFDDFSHTLEVISVTSPTPGLPYITALHDSASAIQSAVSLAIRDLDQSDRDLIGIRSLVSIPKAQYLAVPLPLTR